MNKIVYLAAAFTALAVNAFAYNWYAPNSFDTVKKDSWDYKAVYTLCEEGKAPDYTTSFFSKELTRYEIASVIKNVLDNQKDTPTDENLLKLKKEYSRELEVLGYKEPKKKDSQVKPILEISGDTRVRYNSDSEADARARVNTKWHIGKNTDVAIGGKAETK